MGATCGERQPIYAVMRTSLRLASWLAVLGLLLVVAGVGYGLVNASRHSDPGCGRTSNTAANAPAGPNPCAGSEADWRRATWTLIVPGLASLVAGSAIGLAGAGQRR